MNHDFQIATSVSPSLMLCRRKRGNSPLFSHDVMHSFLHSDWGDAKTTAIILENNAVCSLARSPGLLLALRIWRLIKVSLGKERGADTTETCVPGVAVERFLCSPLCSQCTRRWLPPPQFLEPQPDYLIIFSIHRRKRWG